MSDENFSQDKNLPSNYAQKVAEMTREDLEAEASRLNVTINGLHGRMDEDPNVKEIRAQKQEIEKPYREEIRKFDAMRACVAEASARKGVKGYPTRFDQGALPLAKAAGGEATYEEVAGKGTEKTPPPPTPIRRRKAHPTAQ